MINVRRRVSLPGELLGPARTPPKEVYEMAFTVDAEKHSLPGSGGVGLLVHVEVVDVVVPIKHKRAGLYQAKAHIRAPLVFQRPTAAFS